MRHGRRKHKRPIRLPDPADTRGWNRLLKGLGLSTLKPGIPTPSEHRGLKVARVKRRKRIERNRAAGR